MAFARSVSTRSHLRKRTLLERTILKSPWPRRSIPTSEKGSTFVSYFPYVSNFQRCEVQSGGCYEDQRAGSCAWRAATDCERRLGCISLRVLVRKVGGPIADEECDDPDHIRPDKEEARSDGGVGWWRRSTLRSSVYDQR